MTCTSATPESANGAAAALPDHVATVVIGWVRLGEKQFQVSIDETTQRSELDVFDEHDGPGCHLETHLTLPFLRDPLEGS